MRRAPQASAASSWACWNGVGLGRPTSIPGSARGCPSRALAVRRRRASRGRRPGRPCGRERRAARGRARHARAARRRRAPIPGPSASCLPATASTYREPSGPRRLRTFWSVLDGRRRPTSESRRQAGARRSQGRTGRDDRPPPGPPGRADRAQRALRCRRVRAGALAARAHRGARQGRRPERGRACSSRSRTLDEFLSAAPARDHDGVDRHRLPRRARDRRTDRARDRGTGGPGVATAISVAIAFTLVTSLHITIGEQVPKMIAITRAEPAARRTARPVNWFRVAVRALHARRSTKVSNAILRLFGIEPVELEETHSAEDLQRHHPRVEPGRHARSRARRSCSAASSTSTSRRRVR